MDEQKINQQTEDSFVTETKRTKNFKNKKIIIIAAVCALILILSIIGILYINKDGKANFSENTDDSNLELIEEHSINDEHTHTEVDLTNLPLGDDKYSSEPKQGYVYSCQTSFNGGGASTYGPWINQANNTWDLTKKISVSGDIYWPTAFWDSSSAGETRNIKSADLPYGHNSGTFPIPSSDDAYQYDRNPNSIAEQSVSFSVTKNPKILSSPSCVGGEVGIATTGVLIFSAFDAGGRDAVAVEIQDKCEGHPQAGSYYHYHGYSSCFKDTSSENEHSVLLGYSFDGFGIYGLKGENGEELGSADLDECHGHTHPINWDGVNQEMYHYHFTQDFPYTVSCFMGEASVTAISSGEGNGANQQAQQPQSGGQNSPPPKNAPPKPNSKLILS